MTSSVELDTNIMDQFKLILNKNYQQNINTPILFCSNPTNNNTFEAIFYFTLNDTIAISNQATNDENNSNYTKYTVEEILSLQLVKIERLIENFISNISQYSTDIDSTIINVKFSKITHSFVFNRNNINSYNNPSYTNNNYSNNNISSNSQNVIRYYIETELAESCHNSNNNTNMSNNSNKNENSDNNDWFVDRLPESIIVIILSFTTLFFCVTTIGCTYLWYTLTSLKCANDEIARKRKALKYSRHSTRNLSYNNNDEDTYYGSRSCVHNTICPNCKSINNINGNSVPPGARRHSHDHSKLSKSSSKGRFTHKILNASNRGFSFSFKTKSKSKSKSSNQSNSNSKSKSKTSGGGVGVVAGISSETNIISVYNIDIDHGEDNLHDGDRNLNGMICPSCGYNRRSVTDMYIGIDKNDKSSSNNNNNNNHNNNNNNNNVKFHEQDLSCATLKTPTNFIPTRHENRNKDEENEGNTRYMFDTSTSDLLQHIIVVNDDKNDDNYNNTNNNNGNKNDDNGDVEQVEQKHGTENRLNTNNGTCCDNKKRVSVANDMYSDNDINDGNDKKDNDIDDNGTENDKNDQGGNESVRGSRNENKNKSIEVSNVDNVDNDEDDEKNSDSCVSNTPMVAPQTISQETDYIAVNSNSRMTRRTSINQDLDGENSISKSSSSRTDLEYVENRHKNINNNNNRKKKNNTKEKNEKIKVNGDCMSYIDSESVETIKRVNKVEFQDENENERDATSENEPLMANEK